MADSEHKSGFTPIRPNPYIVGNPVRDPKMFFGREAEFALVRKRFRDSERGGLLVFCGERRSGKTSILFQILDGRLGPDFIPVLIDMQSMAIQSEVDFLSKIAEEIVEVLRGQGLSVPPPKFEEDSKASASFLRFIQWVLEACPGKKPILLFDEYELFENKIDAGILSEDVLNMLSHLMETYSVFLIFTGSQNVEQRRQPYWKILGRSLHRTISYLEHDDALRLIRQPVEGRIHYVEGIDETIYRLTAGQPFYTQAVCQNLVDHLNIAQTNDATQEAVSSVVNDIVNNAFPQMIFLWETLERNEKLVLGLLAEELQDEDTHASANQLIKLLSSRNYPLDLDEAAVATALEKLFKQELLLKDHATPPGYAFRIDLWRHWVRRMHSVWQVIREEGIEIRRPPKRRWRIAVPVGAVLALIVVVAIRWWPPNGRNDPGPPEPPPQFAHLVLQTLGGATIYQDGQVVGMGQVSGQIIAGRDHVFRITAWGYADSTFMLHPTADDSLSYQVDLRALLGDLRIETEPPGATIVVDGQTQATPSPLTLRGLPTADTHRIVASLPGFQRAEDSVTLQPDTIVTASLSLERQTADVVVVTEPSGAQVLVDAEAQGTTPLDLRRLPVGPHRFRATLAGYVSADTTVQVTRELGTLKLALEAEPPGYLTIQGDYPAEIWVDGTLVVRGVQNSGERELRGGTHHIRVIMTSGETVEDEVGVGPGQNVVYDYSLKTVIRRSPRGSE